MYGCSGISFFSVIDQLHVLNHETTRHKAILIIVVANEMVERSTESNNCLSELIHYSHRIIFRPRIDCSHCDSHKLQHENRDILPVWLYQSISPYWDWLRFCDTHNVSLTRLSLRVVLWVDWGLLQFVVCIQRSLAQLFRHSSKNSLSLVEKRASITGLLFGLVKMQKGLILILCLIMIVTVLIAVFVVKRLKRL